MTPGIYAITVLTECLSVSDEIEIVSYEANGRMIEELFTGEVTLMR